ncbi:MAG: hypothetical protein OWU33_15365 [Firmicutes bacterium]|nr:hypothetical protein [Bacillota bacterium]
MATDLFFRRVPWLDVVSREAGADLRQGSAKRVDLLVVALVGIV